MPNTYSQIYFHIVFAVRNRQSLIHTHLKESLYRYITGIVTNQGQKLLIINGHYDHVHLLLSCKPTVRLDELVKEIKEHSTKFINSNNLVHGKFYWQAGYGAFSVGRHNLDLIFEYIRKQEEHHSTKKFTNEFVELLTEEKIEFDPKYIFADPMNVD